VTPDNSFIEWVYFIWQNNWPLVVIGARNTLIIALSGTIIGFFIGIVFGIIRTIPIDHKTHPLLRTGYNAVNFILLSYIEVFRGTPMMVQAMVIFYGAAMVYGIHLDPSPAGIIIVSINTGALWRK
jgi:putative lysine transport system permease protein